MKRFIFPLLVVAFVLTGLQTSYMRRDLFHTDQSIFIDLAYGFSKCQSSVKLIPPVHIALASKSETHPLAPYFFSFLTGNFKLLYPLGKLLNLFWGLLTLLVLNRVVKKHCGEIAGLTAAFCLATNLFYRYNCVQLTSEPLLLLFFILWIDYSVACIGAADDCMSPWCLAGAMAGFAYLAKPNAILLPIVFAMAFLVKRKRPAVLPFLSFYICFLIIVAPLLVARARQGEFPLYNANFNTVFAMTVDDYDDAHDIPFIAQRGLLDNMKRAVKFNHLKKYLFHIPVFFKYLVNRLFNRILPGPIPGVFWLTVACYLLWLFANSEQTRNVAPFIVVFFILYCIALIPVTINNDSARFFFPLQVCLYFVFGHLVDRKFGEQAVPILLLVTLSYFLVVPIPSMLAGPFGNPLEATDASIEIVEDWLSKQSSPLIVYYTFYEKWWLERLYGIGEKKGGIINFIEVDKKKIESGLAAEPDSVLLLSTRNFSFILKDADCQRLFPQDYLPHRFSMADQTYVQVLPRCVCKIAAYRLLKEIKERPLREPTSK